jgi:N-acetylglucosaminyldiphosphoundecaprenol N-acetyl-beta-D-mannosaminyltransferase
MQALNDEELADVIRHCGLVVPDGSGVVWALRRHGDVVQKVAGVDLVRAMAARAGKEGFGIYFLGAKPGVAREAADNLAAQFPGMRIAGARDGYFKPEDEPALFDEIRAAKPDILLVALGVPRQEKWIVQHQKALGVAVAMGVGGSLDVFAGRVKRAPAGFQRLHIEWLYRLIQEPWRFQRMQSTLPAFVGEVLKRG